MDRFDDSGGAAGTSDPLPPTVRIRLGDGRMLGVLTVGDPAGYPVIHNHGGLSSRLDVVGAHDAALGHGLRIISPDRPGIGSSDPRPGRTLDDWTSDVAELADALGLERFAVMGWSLGGGFAQAVAHQLGERTAALALIASAIPRQWPGMLEQINRMDRRFMGLSRRAPGRSVSRLTFATMGAAARRAPALFARLSGFPAGSTDQITHAVAEGLAHPHGVVEEYRILDSQWSFEPSRITAPTRIWQGDADDLVPAEWGKRLQAAIAGSTLTAVPGGTHFLAFDRWQEILGWLAETSR